MREPSSISQQRYPIDVRTIFMQICTFSRGACFGLGNILLNSYVNSYYFKNKNKMIFIMN